ncbi:MAG: hypothetical protein K8T91_17505 [Planctomycetes bacterium]|nr:hypothetical protein [Planctomycetota bacterium]
MRFSHRIVCPRFVAVVAILVVFIGVVHRSFGDEPVSANKPPIAPKSEEANPEAKADEKQPDASKPAEPVQPKKPKGPPAGLDGPKDFLHPPLECMQRFQRIDKYPLVGWCFHGKGGGGHDEEYLRKAMGAGFNVMIDSARMLEPAAKVGNVKILPVAFRWPVEKLQAEILDPHLIPYISENPDPSAQARTPMRILSTQNYMIKNGGHGPDARRSYCSGMGRDLVNSNRHKMAFWPIWVTPCSTSEMRFQHYVALAYGAQGVVCFAYTPNRPNWFVDKWNYSDAKEINKSVAEIFGPRVWGCRSPGVIHAPGRDAPKPEAKATVGMIVEKLDPQMLASPLVLEKDFYLEGGPGKPTYIMVVDKRTSEKNKDEPEKRSARVDFGPQIRLVELLGPVHSKEPTLRRIEPAWSVPYDLKAGEGIILGVDPPDVDKLLGELAKPYWDILGKTREARELLRQKEIDFAAVEKALEAIAPQVQAIKQRAAAGGKEELAATQRRDMVERLAARFDDVVAAAKAAKEAPKPAEPAPTDAKEEKK